ncbi:hypothetical protein YC2023_008460 [Brassica napus]
MSPHSPRFSPARRLVKLRTCRCGPISASRLHGLRTRQFAYPPPRRVQSHAKLNLCLIPAWEISGEEANLRRDDMGSPATTESQSLSRSEQTKASLFKLQKEHKKTEDMTSAVSLHDHFSDVVTREEDLIQVKLKRVDWSLLCYCDIPRMLDHITETDLIKPSCVWSGFASETECVVSDVVENILQQLMPDISHEHLSESYSSSRRLFRTSSHFGKSMISINNSLQRSQAPRHINQIVISAFSVHLGSHGLILEKVHKLATTGTNSSSRRNIT